MNEDRAYMRRDRWWRCVRWSRHLWSGDVCVLKECKMNECMCLIGDDGGDGKEGKGR